MNTVTRIKKISPVQLGKMLAVIYGLLSLIAVPFLLLFGFLSAAAGHASGSPLSGFGSSAFGAGLGIGMALLFPLMYAMFGFIAGAIGALVYNLVAKWVGGIEIEFESASES